MTWDEEMLFLELEGYSCLYYLLSYVIMQGLSFEE
jgi:hypothetical protein